MNILSVIMVLPLLVVLTNMLTNVIKGWGGIFAAQPQIVATIVAEVLSIGATVAYCQSFSVAATWYLVAGGAVAGGVVAYVAMNGYDGLYEDLIRHLKGLTGGEDR